MFYKGDWSGMGGGIKGMYEYRGVLLMMDSDDNCYFCN